MFHRSPGYQALLRAHHIREAGVVQSLVCSECDDAHDAEIVHEGGRYGFYCPELGFVPVERSAVIGLVANLPNLVAGVADAFRCKRRKSTAVHGTTWRIGAIGSHGADVVLCFHPHLKDARDVSQVEATLAREVAAPYRLILTAEGRLPVPGATTARLAEVVEIDEETGRLVTTANPAVIAGAPVKRIGGAPNQFRNATTQMIRARIDAGTALSGHDEEANAVRSALEKQSPDARAPSLATVKRYLSEIRGGS
jgi:hypothetical protein